MNNTNKFVSSDNVGYASILLEQEYNKGYMVGKGSFVGAFCSANLGDVSPNIMGPRCAVSMVIKESKNMKLLEIIKILSRSLASHAIL